MTAETSKPSEIQKSPLKNPLAWSKIEMSRSYNNVRIKWVRMNKNRHSRMATIPL